MSETPLAERFKERAEYLSRLEIEFRQEYDYGKQGTEERHRFDVPLFTRIRVNLTPVEWMHMCSSAGEHYIGGCCGTASAAQDVVCHVFRFDEGWFSASQLMEIATLLENHHDESTFKLNPETPLSEVVGKASKKWKKMDPWAKIGVAWQIISGHCVERLPNGSPPALKGTLDETLHTAAEGLRSLDTHRLFSRFFDKDKPVMAQDLTGDYMWLARYLPSINLVVERLQTLYKGPIDGFALIDKGTGPDSIAINGLGYCVYATRKEAEDMIAQWREAEAEYEERVRPGEGVGDRIEIRPVRVTDKGYEFLSK